MEVKKVKTDVNTTSVVSEDGELLNEETEVKHTYIALDTPEDFYWTYSKVMGIIKHLSKAEMKIIYYACIKSQMNTNMIIFNKPICEDITNVLGIEYQTIKNTIHSLKKKGVLTAVGSGTYYINPQYYWKGSSVNRRKFILEIHQK